MGVADDFRAGRSGETGMVARLSVQGRKQNAEHFGRNVLPAGFVPSREDQREQAIPVLPGFNPGQGGRNMPRWKIELLV